MTASTVPAPAGAAPPPNSRPRRPAPPGTARRSAPRAVSTPYWLLLPAGLWLAVFFVAPFFYQASTSVQSGSLEEGFRVTWDFSNYSDALATYGPHFLRSFLYAGRSHPALSAHRLPARVHDRLPRGPLALVLLVMVIAPFFTSFLIRTLAWKTILSDGGPVVGVLKSVHILDFTSQLGLTGDERLLATPLAVVCGLTYNFLPFMILPLYSSLERIDLSLHEAARDLYAKPATIFRKVTFPLSLPGVVAGTLLTFIPASGDYINAQLLGSPNTQMIGNAIQKQFLNVLDYPAAAAMSFILMAIILILVSVYMRKAGTEELV